MLRSSWYIIVFGFNNEKLSGVAEKVTHPILYRAYQMEVKILSGAATNMAELICNSV